MTSHSLDEIGYPVEMASFPFNLRLVGSGRS
jgi:hypothetical protein